MSSTGLAAAPDLGEQRVVLHVARADLDHVGDLDHVVDVAHVHQLGDDRQPGLLLRLLQQPQPLDPEALEAVRRGARLVGAAAQHRRAVLGDHARRLQRLLAALDRARAGDQAEVVAADPPAVDLDHGPLALLELRRGELVRLQDRDQVVDPVVALEPERGDPVAVADRPDHGQQLALREVGRTADLLDSLDDVGDLLLRRPLFHHDHHLALKPFNLCVLLRRF